MRPSIMSTGIASVLEELQEIPLVTRVGEKSASFCSPSNYKKRSGSLATGCVSAIMESLGEIATGRFSCGGTLKTLCPTGVRLTYLGKSGQWNGASFPGLTDTDFKQLLESSSVASFGRGKETVTDKSIRDAFVLEPDKFLTSFRLPETSVLEEIRMLLAPGVTSIRAELYKMNIYSSPTGCFKAHVDTPRGGNMFGSLVVCLPSQFSGGALVTRHNGHESTYDWSTSTPAADGGVPAAQKIRWAAFYSDVEHEILPVTEGHRVTLTYNLYHCTEPSTVELDVTASPFYKNLKVALEHPHFMREGGILGFACQHSYVFDKLEKSSAESLPLLLKGSDRMVVSSAKSLGLAVQVKPEYDFHDTWEEELHSIDLPFDGDDSGTLYVDESFQFKNKCIGVKPSPENKHPSCQSFALLDGGDYQTCDKITWCQEIVWQPAQVAPHYGNEASMGILYQVAAILLTIPKWSSPRRHDGLK